MTATPPARAAVLDPQTEGDPPAGDSATHDPSDRFVLPADAPYLTNPAINSAKTAENIARNLAWRAASPCLSRLTDRFKGEPPVIVSAGPSLRKNQHLLPQVDGKAVLIAVQTTL